jgi:integration host factor subunit beta
MGAAMTKSDLINLLSGKYGQLSAREIEWAIKGLIEQMAETLSSGDRIEIRGFGSFSLHYRRPRIGRNPKTGAQVELDSKFVPHFKPGKKLREIVNDSKTKVALKPEA